jgi:type IV secretory pathway VirJ component
VTRTRLAAVAIGAALSVACGFNRIHTEPQTNVRRSSTRMLLEGKPFDLHLARPATPRADDVLVVYASGDGGWFGAAVHMFEEIPRNGYYAAGFSSRAFLNLERPSGEVATLDRLVGDYESIIAQAQGAMGLPASTRTVLTGWSRGAAFAVLVASHPRERRRIAGVVAIGLDEGADLAKHNDEGDDDDDHGRVFDKGRRPSFDTYHLMKSSSLRAVVIQATGDQYLPASEARRLFGDDSPTRRFFAVEARNHRFSGATAPFDRTLGCALAWVVAPPSP